MNYVIGVDAGGTKTEAIAYDLQGEELAKIITGCGNLVCGQEDGIRNILESINRCIDILGKDELKKIYVGAAGMEVGNNAFLIEKSIKDTFNKEVLVVNDGELALRAVLRGKDGILTIAGTGSIVIGVNGDKKEKCGGWGHLLGDEGSGYAIAIKAFKQMICERDSNLKYSELSKEILRELNCNSADEITKFIYSSGKDKIASITTLVSSLADKGNEDALKILLEEGKSLGLTTERLHRMLAFKGQCNIGIKGSVIEKSKGLRSSFENYIKANLKDINIVSEEVSSAKGAYYMYLRHI